MTKASTSYWSDTRSANPHPVCRRGGCPLLAVDGSDWCADHEAIVTAARRRGEDEHRRLLHGDKSMAHSRFGDGR